MQVVARQQNDVAGSKHEFLSVLAVDPDTELTLDDVVIKNQVRCWPESRRAMFWRDAGGHTPWREEIGVQENAASQVRYSQNVGQCVHTGPSIRIRCFGHVSRYAGHRPSPVSRPKDRCISRSVCLCRRRTTPQKETEMNVISNISDNGDRYARCIETSKRVRWDIDKDVIRGRNFDTAHKFLPDGLCLADTFTTLSVDEKRFVSQIQGRTYANIFGLVERFINAKVLELSEDHWFGDQVALEALVRFSDEELKHQALFRLVDAMVSDVLPAGYRFDVDHNAVAHAVLGKSTWAVLALTLDIELFTQLTIVRASTPIPLRAVQRRVPFSLERGKPARDPRRTRVGAP